jgi:hypothetical protein
MRPSSAGAIQETVCLGHLVSPGLSSWSWEIPGARAEWVEWVCAIVACAEMRICFSAASRSGFCVGRSGRMVCRRGAGCLVLLLGLRQARCLGCA